MQFSVEDFELFGTLQKVLVYGDPNDMQRILMGVRPEEENLDADRFERFQHELLEFNAELPVNIARLPEMVDWAAERGEPWSFRVLTDVDYGDRIQFSFGSLTTATYFKLLFSVDGARA